MGVRIVIAGALVALAALPALPAPTAEAGHLPCDPYPIGRCGNYNRETVTMCYIIVAGRYVSATDPHVVAIGGASGVAIDSAEQAKAYLRLAPTERFLGDVYEEDLPYQSVFQETNSIAGLQPVPLKCGQFVWFPECDPGQWMGPYFVVNRPADQYVI